MAENSAEAAVSVSTRELAKHTGSSRRFLQSALDNLTARGLLTTRQGTATRAAIYVVNALKTAFMGGAPTAPPGRSSNATPGAFAAPPPALFDHHPGAVGAPPPTENKELPPRHAPLDSDTDTTTILDRVIRARKKDYTAEQIETARAWLLGYRRKLANQPTCLAPDDDICAKFLAVADWPALQNTLYELFKQRIPPGENDGWFVAVALNRIHGFKPDALKTRKAQLKLVKPAQPGPPDSRQFTQDLLAGLNANVGNLK